MGFLRFIKDELVEIIESTEDDGDVLMHRFAERGKNIKQGAQLTVREGQKALFINEGQIADLYGPGRHVLTTENMPVLSRLQGWSHGFRSPFLCDVYFFSTRLFSGLKWGTGSPIMMRDPLFQQVRVRAFGSYTLRLKDAATFFRQAAGHAPKVTAPEIGERLRHALVSRFSESLATLNVSVLDLARNYSMLGERLVPWLQPEFEALGLELVSFVVENTSVPPEVEATFDKATQMNVVGDMARYAQFEAARSLGQPGPKGAAGTGVELGAGLALGQQMANLLQQGAGGGGAAGMPVGAAAGAAATGDARAQILATLKELGALRDAGVLTDEEFRAKKAELLAKL